MSFNLKTELRDLRLYRESFEVQAGDEQYDPNMESTTCVAHDLDDLFEPDPSIEEAKDRSQIEIIDDAQLMIESIQHAKINLTPFEKIALKASLAQITTGKRKPLLSIESLQSDNFLTLAHEDLREKATALKKSAGDFIRKIWEAVVKSLRNVFGKNERLRKRGRALLKLLEEKLPRETGPDFEWEGFKHSGAIRRDGVTSFQQIYDILEILEDMFESNTNDISDALVNAKDNSEETLKGIYGRFSELCRFIEKDASQLSRGSGTDKTIEFKDGDGNEGVVKALYNISDRWGFSVREVNIDGVFFTTPDISPYTLNAPMSLTVPSMGKEQAKGLLLKTLSVLQLNIREDIRNSDKILRNAKLPKDSNNKLLAAAYKDLANFVKNRNEMRYNTCNEVISYLEVVLKESANTSSEDPSGNKSD